MKETPNYYSIIPAPVRYDKRLRANEKVLYSELTALSNKKGYCWASNQYIADLYQVDTRTVSKWVSNLHKYGYIDVEIANNTSRKIWIVQIDTQDQKIEPQRSKDEAPQRSKDPHNTTSYNTKKNKDFFDETNKTKTNGLTDSLTSSRRKAQPSGEPYQEPVKKKKAGKKSAGEIESENELIAKHSDLIGRVTKVLNKEKVYMRNTDFPKATKLIIARYVEEMGLYEFKKRFTLANGYVVNYEAADNPDSKEFWSKKDGGFLLRFLNRYYERALDKELEIDDS